MSVEAESYILESLFSNRQQTPEQTDSKSTRPNTTLLTDSCLHCLSSSQQSWSLWDTSYWTKVEKKALCLSLSGSSCPSLLIQSTRIRLHLMMAAGPSFVSDTEHQHKSVRCRGWLTSKGRGLSYYQEPRMWSVELIHLFQYTDQWMFCLGKGYEITII